MSPNLAKLKEDYFRLLEDPRALQELGLVRDSSAIQPIRPLDGKNIGGALAQASLESLLIAALDKDEPLEFSGRLLEDLIERGGSEQSTLDKSREEVLSTIDRIRLSFPIPYLLADFPLSYPFNAATVLRREGALVLVNRGLTDMIWFAANLFVSTVGIQFMDGTAEVGTMDPMPFSKEGITASFAEVILAYLQHKNAHAAGHLLPQFGRKRSIVVAYLMNESIKFVIAHEFAHIIAGHLTNDVRSPGSSDKDDLVAQVVIQVFKSLERDSLSHRLTRRGSASVGQQWVKEIDADQAGLRILFAALGSLEGERKLFIDARKPLFEFIAAAPFFLFGLYGLIGEVEKARVGLKGRILLSDHPPVELRVEFVKMTYKSWGMPQLPRMANQILDWIASVQESVVEAAVSKLNS
jgi:hypothetical protein